MKAFQNKKMIILKPNTARIYKKKIHSPAMFALHILKRKSSSSRKKPLEKIKLIPLVVYLGKLESTWSNTNKEYSLTYWFYNIIIRSILKITDKIINHYTKESNSLHKSFIIKTI